MTDTERAAITEHLAEKVCGWPRVYPNDKHIYSYYWTKPEGGNVYPDLFSPLTDPRDCSMVMEAWRKLGCAWAVLSTFNHDGYANATAWRSNGSMEHVTWDDKLTSWTEAVCVAIYRASREGARS